MVEHLVASPPDRRVTEIRFSSIQGIPTNDLEQRKSSGESQLDSFSDALESVSNNAVSLAKSLMRKRQGPRPVGCAVKPTPAMVGVINDE